MLNQVAVEALYSASYVEDYLDCVENLPDDVQRYFTQLREYDQKYQDILHDLSQYQDSLDKDVDALGRKRVLLQIQRALIQAQELGDEKIEVMNNVQDLVENKSKQLETDYKNLDFGRENENMDNNRSEIQPERCSKRSRRQRNQDLLAKDDPLFERVDKEGSLFGGTLAPIASSSNTNSGMTASLTHYTNTAVGNKKKKKKRKTKGDKGRDSSPIDPPIDPNEPTYCLCVQVSYGEMIGCDNEECPIEWFHFSCVGLTTKPKGKWFCPKCRGDRSNQMKQR